MKSLELTIVLNFKNKIQTTIEMRIHFSATFISTTTITSSDFAYCNGAKSYREL
ncbi:MAG: hypothetical protein H7250_13095 [Flavobacterium sp.]|nr:hypothetical protein [Flavobacterium sp.]